MKIIFPILFSLITISGYAQKTVPVTDTAFLSYLKTRIPYCIQGNLLDTTCSGLDSIALININGRKISDIRWIKYFSNLVEFRCKYNDISNIDMLPASLERLYCDYNKLTDINKLPPNLQVFVCDSNQLGSLPPLPNSLVLLQCIGTYLVSLPYKLPSNLNTLLCYRNFIKQLPPLPSSIINLDVTNNQISEIPELPAGLLYLSCGFNQLDELPELPAGILTLNCFNNQLTHLPDLPAKMRILDCANNQIKCFPMFPQSMFSKCKLDNNPYACVPNIVSGMDAATKAKTVCVKNDSIGNPYACDTFGNSNLSVGIMPQSRPIQISVYPNPSSGIYTIIPEDKFSSLIYTYDIFNSEGKLILSGETESELTVIDLSGYTNGLYIIRVKNDHSSLHLNILKF